MRKRRKDRDGLYERPNSPYYWVSFIDAGGRRVRRSTGIRKSREGRREAETLLAEWKQDARASNEACTGNEPVVKTRLTFDEVLLNYLKATRMEKHAERDKYSAKHLYPFFTRMVLTDIRKRDVTEYVSGRRESASNGTINKELGLLSRMFSWTREELEIDVTNPARTGQLVETERMRWITQGEAQALVREAARDSRAGHLVDFIHLGLHTGMRKGEMLGLEWRRVDLQSGLVYLEPQDQKNAKFGSIPLNGEARNAIFARARFRARHCPDSPWVFCHEDGSRIKDVRKSFFSACSRAGIDDFRPHDLRHSCAAWLVQSGVPIREVSELLRHSDIQITMRYAHLAPENVRAAVTKLESKSSSHYRHTEARSGVLKVV